jgi:hypothetical protein
MHQPGAPTPMPAIAHSTVNVPQETARTKFASPLATLSSPTSTSLMTASVPVELNAILLIAPHQTHVSHFASMAQILPILMDVNVQ